MAPSHTHTSPTNKSFFFTLARGEHGLNATFWYFGIIPLLIWSLLTTASYLRAEFFFTLVLTLSFLIYSPFEIIGLVQSAKSFRGKKLWARMAMLLVVMWLLIFVAFFFIFLTTL